MARVDALATERQYLDHLEPIWRALSREERGTLYITAELAVEATARGLEAQALTRNSLRTGPLTLVASFADEQRARGRPIALLEHGAGQSYTGEHPSYSGGRGHQNVKLFLCPNESVASRWRALYADSRIAVVGSPKLDPVWLRKWPRNQPPVIAISFHWDCQIAPEARSAFSHYARALGELPKRWQTLGHGHPRIFDRLEKRYRLVGIEPVRDFAEVLKRADVYVIDNSSTALEFMATGKPVVWLNAPQYRRDVWHGGRFWDWPRALPVVDEPEQLIAGIDRALIDPVRDRARRREIVEEVYAVRDGSSAARAAQAIREVAGCQQQ